MYFGRKWGKWFCQATDGYWHTIMYKDNTIQNDKVPPLTFPCGPIKAPPCLLCAVLAWRLGVRLGVHIQFTTVVAAPPAL